MRLIIASNNKNKIREIKEILGDKFEEIVSMREAGIELDVKEDADSFIGNARKKAEETAKLCPQDAVLADDSGLCVDALNGAPGVYSARYAGEHGNDEKNNELLLKNLSDIPMDKRTARFVSTVCCCFPDGRHMTVRGECEGKIAFEPAGEGGFGYDPLFLPDEFPGKTMAQLTAEEKDSISHRGKALRLLAKKLEEII